MTDTVQARAPQRWQTAWLARIGAETGAFLRFVRRPVRGRPHPAGWQASGVRIALLLLLTLGLVIALFPLLDWLLTYLGISSMGRKELTGFGLWFTALVLAPIIEECVFRAGLRSARYTLFIGPSIVGLTLGSAWPALALVMVTVVIGAIDWKKSTTCRPGLRFARGRRFIALYPCVFYLYTIAFAWAHIFKFQYFGWSGLMLWAAVLPQFMGGCALGYLRLRNGLVCAMLMHALHNLIGLSALQIFSS